MSTRKTGFAAMIATVRGLAVGQEGLELKPEILKDWSEVLRMFIGPDGSALIPPRNVILSVSPSDFYIVYRVSVKIGKLEKAATKMKDYKDGIASFAPDDEGARRELLNRVTGNLLKLISEEDKKKIMSSKVSKSEKESADKWLESFEGDSGSSVGGDEVEDMRKKTWADVEEEEDEPPKPPKQAEPSSFQTDETMNPWSDTKSSGNPKSDSEPYDVVKRVMELSESLDYDRFDAKRIRELICRSKPSLDDMITILSAYVSVGNNPSNLDTKVRDPKVGKMVLQVCNKFKIVRQKVNSTTLTLARVAIAFAPAVLLIRMLKAERGSLAGASVRTTTPVLYQDVCLSALSVSLKFDGEIEDFLLKFNRELMKAAEKGRDKKTKEEDMDEQCRKFINLSHSNASADTDVHNWVLTKDKTENQLLDFLSSMLSKYSV